MIKIRAPRPACRRSRIVLAAGINVNVTLLFAVERYAEVIEAFLTGLTRRADAGQPVRSAASVASFFVSRLDGKIDPALDERRSRLERRPSAPWHDRHRQRVRRVSPVRTSRWAGRSGSDSRNWVRNPSGRCGHRPARRSPLRRCSITSKRS